MVISGVRPRPAPCRSLPCPCRSVSWKRLLGTVLFERGARQVRLTTFGESLVLRARDILCSVDEIGDLARSKGDRLVGRLRLGVIPTVAPYLLPTVIGHLRRTNPDLDVQARETVTPKLLQELAEGRLDTAIVALPVSEPSLAEAALFSEDFVLVRPVEDDGKPVPDPETLREMRLLLLEEGHCFRDQALSVCGLPSNRPREILDASSLSTLVQMVGAGMGVTLDPRDGGGRRDALGTCLHRPLRPSPTFADHWHGVAQIQPAGTPSVQDRRGGPRSRRGAAGRFKNDVNSQAGSQPVSLLGLLPRPHGCIMERRAGPRSRRLRTWSGSL